MPLPAVANYENPYGPLVSFRSQRVFPPSAVYVSPDDALALEVNSPYGTFTIHSTLRTMTPQGEMKATHWDQIIQQTGATSTTVTLPPSEGFLISASISVPAAKRGQVFCKLYLLRGNVGPDPTLGALLCQGYSAGVDRLSYPQSPTESATSGDGVLTKVVPAVPAPGADLVAVVPAGQRWRVKSVFVQLITNVTAGNRTALFNFFDDVGASAGFIPPAAVVGPSSNINFTWGDGVAYANLGLSQSIPILRDLILSPGWGLATLTLGMSAGDQWGQAFVFVEEYVAP